MDSDNKLGGAIDLQQFVYRIDCHFEYNVNCPLVTLRNFSITPCTPFGIGVMSGRDQRSRAVGVAHVRPAIHQRPNGRRRVRHGEPLRLRGVQ